MTRGSNYTEISEPLYGFREPNSLIFLTGAPLSGKSTLTPQLTASIQGCVSQNMDIFRLLAGRENEKLPPASRNPFLQYGSCDSYFAVGNGEFSEEGLLEGLRLNAEVICKPLDYVIPKLEAQGAQNVLFEGVQLLPGIVKRFMEQNHRSRYIILTANAKDFEARRDQVYTGDSAEFGAKYTVDKLKAIEAFLINQAADTLPSESVFVAENIESLGRTLQTIIEFLRKSGLIQKYKVSV